MWCNVAVFLGNIPMIVIVATGAGTRGRGYNWLRHLSLRKFECLTSKIFKIRRKIEFFWHNYVPSISSTPIECALLDKFVTSAQIYSTKFWCQFVHRFPNLAAQYYVNKANFSSKFTQNGKCRFQILKKSYQWIQKIHRNACNIVLFILLYIYFTCFEAVNLV